MEDFTLLYLVSILVVFYCMVGSLASVLKEGTSALLRNKITLGGGSIMNATIMLHMAGTEFPSVLEFISSLLALSSLREYAFTFIDELLFILTVAVVFGIVVAKALVAWRRLASENLKETKLPAN